jgi:hypothetical protein
MLGAGCMKYDPDDIGTIEANLKCLCDFIERSNRHVGFYEMGQLRGDFKTILELYAYYTEPSSTPSKNETSARGFFSFYAFIKYGIEKYGDLHMLRLSLFGPSEQDIKTATEIKDMNL